MECPVRFLKYNGRERERERERQREAEP